MLPSLCTRRYFITGSQRLTNYLWALFISLGGISFLVTGFFSFLQLFKEISVETSLSRSVANSLSYATKHIESAQTISFFPQGLLMCFYGSLGLLFGLYLWCTIFWKVGNGFNEFDKESGVLRIFRWGLPGVERRIDLRYKIKDIESLRVELKEGVNPKRTISLNIKGKGEIPLTRIGQPIGLEDVENEASELAQFLQVSLETFYKI